MCLRKTRCGEIIHSLIKINDAEFCRVSNEGRVGRDFRASARRRSLFPTWGAILEIFRPSWAESCKKSQFAKSDQTSYKTTKDFKNIGKKDKNQTWKENCGEKKSYNSRIQGSKEEQSSGNRRSKKLSSCSKEKFSSRCLQRFVEELAVCERSFQMVQIEGKDGKVGKIEALSEGAEQD